LLFEITSTKIIDPQWAKKAQGIVQHLNVGVCLIDYKMKKIELTLQADIISHKKNQHWKKYS